MTSPWEQFFNNHAPVYETNCFTQNTAYEVEFIIQELGLQPGASILDVGCGTGRHSVPLAARGYRVTGVDISAGMLEQAANAAQAANVSLRLIHSDATKFSIDEQFDAVLCLCEGAFGLIGAGDDPIEHALAVLRNIAASLKPGAKCLFTVLNGYWMNRKYTQDDVEKGLFDPLTLTMASECTPFEDAHQAPAREKGFVPTELRLLFRLAGLNVQQIWGGTAGAWNRQPINLDEIEIMVVAQANK